MKKGQQLIERRCTNGKAYSVHSGPSVLNPNSESIVYTWILSQRKIVFSVSTVDVFTKALQILLNFNNGSRKLLHFWAYMFNKRYSLVFRSPTPISQYTIEEMEARRVKFAQSTMTHVQMNGINEHYLVNMDETAVNFDSNHNCTINKKEAKTVSVQRGSTANKRCTVCVTVAADGNKLPLFVIFKGISSGQIAKELSSIFAKWHVWMHIGESVDG